MKVGRRFLYFSLLFYFIILPISLQAITFKDIVFKPAKSEFIIESEDEIETTSSNIIKLKVKKDINKTKPYTPKLLLYHYSTKSDSFLKVNTTKYAPSDNSSEVEFKRVAPLKLEDGKEIDLSKKLPLTTCLVFKKNEPIFIIYEDKNYKKKGIKVEIKSSNDKEIVEIKRVSKNSSLFVGYINTTSHCQKRCDGKLYLKKGAKIEATIYQEGLKRVRSLQSTKIISTTAYVEVAPNLKPLNQKEQKDADIWLDIDSSKDIASKGEFIKVSIFFENKGDKLPKYLSIKGDLSSQASYLKDSFKIDGVAIKDKVTFKKDSFLIDLDNPKKLPKEISFIIKVGINARGKIVSNIIAKYDNLQTNRASVRIKVDDDFTQKSEILGEIIFDKGSKKDSIRVYLDDGKFVFSDRFGRFHFKDLDNSLHVVSIDPSSIKGRYEAYECKENRDSLGSAISRYIDMSDSKVARVKFCLKESNLTKELKPTISYKIPKPKEQKMPNYSKSSFDTFLLKDRFLWPKEDFLPSMPSIKVAFLHRLDEKLKLFINTKAVDMLNYDGFVKSADKSFVIDKYRGIDIDEEDNILEAKLYSKDGKLIKTLKRKIHFTTSPTRAVIQKDRSNLLADGKHIPVIAVKFYDRAGYPLRMGVGGEFELSKPYISQDRLDLISQNPLAPNQNKNHYIIQNDGIAYIRLKPTTQSGEVKLHFDFQNSNEYLKAFLKPTKREWIVVGFAKGSVGYQEIRKHLKRGGENEVISDGKISLFAKGSISKDTLLTIAYKSHKDRFDKKRFEKELDLESQFSVYGDDSIAQNEAPSSQHLYIKIERGSFSAMFGDFDTSLDERELSRYSRRFSGLKSSYHSDRFDYTIFYTDKADSFIREEITPDGTSGAYHLKHKDILPQTQRVYLESRQRYRDENVISKREFNNILDYTIDYSSGKIYFKEPISRRDAFGNEQKIIVEYELDSKRAKSEVYGGRGGIKFLNAQGEIGVTYIREQNKQGGFDDLRGVDMMLNPTKDTTINAEFATSKKKDSTNAYKVEFVAHKNFITSKAYYKYQESGFGLNRLSSTQDGVEKYGVDMTINYIQNMALKLAYFRDRSLKSDEAKESFESILQYNRYGYLGTIGYRSSNSNREKSAYSQIVTSLQKRFFHSKLKASVSYEKSLSGRSDYFEDRKFGELSYALSNRFDIFVNHEILDGLSKKKRLSKAGIRGRVFENTTIESSVVDEFENDSIRLFGLLGLNQYWQIDDNLSITANLEREQTIEKKGVKNSDDFSSYSIGANYRKKSYIYNAKVEYRDGEDEDKINLNFGVYSEINRDLGLAFGIRESFIDTNSTLNKEGMIRLSLAYRGDENLLLLAKSEFKHQDDEYEDNQKFINTIKGVYDLKRARFSGYYALKYTKDKIDTRSYDSLIGSFGSDLNYQIDKKLDLGVRGSILHSFDSSESQKSAGVCLGYNFFKNLYFGVGYNFVGFYDSDLSLLDKSAKGVYLNMLLKFDRESLDEVLERF